MDPETDEPAEGHVVNVGLFGWLNPQIFVPSWFEAHELLSPEAVKEAKIAADTPALVAFRVEGFTVQVTLDRFLIWSNVGQAEVIRDIAKRCFALLPHTPMNGIGLNHEFQIPFEDPDRFLASLAPAASFAGEFDSAPQRHLELSGEANDSGTRLRLVVERSERIENGIYAALIQDHAVEADEGDWIGTCNAALAQLDRLWDDSFERAIRLLKTLQIESTGGKS